MRKNVAEKLTDQISDWSHRGFIDNELLEILKRRYSTDATLGKTLLRWMGFFGVSMLAMSIFSVIGAALGSLTAYIAPFFLSVSACFLWIKGTKMATDPEQHYPTSGVVLVTVGLLTGYAALSTLCRLFDDGSAQNVTPYISLIVGAAAFFTAYRYGLRWPLTLGVLLVFHGIGNMHRYDGHGSYLLGIQDERLALIIALVSIIFGMCHEKFLEKDFNRREVGFGHIYIVFGLCYANLCLWFLSIPHGGLKAVLAFSIACVTQIILGGRFHDGRFIGFGIVFLSVNIYTRMFENFWDDLSKGTFFLISGAIAIAIGIVLERRAKKIKAGAGI